MEYSTLCKLLAIYEEIADKTLRFGCKVNVIKYMVPTWEPYEYETYYIDENNLYGFPTSQYIKSKIVRVVWNPIKIWEVLKYINENFPNDINNQRDKLFKVWNELDKEIDKQSDTCIEYVYELVWWDIEE